MGNVRIIFIFLLLSPIYIHAQVNKVLPAESRNMQLVGVSDLQGRPAYQPVIHQQAKRWIAYIGLHKGSEINPLNGQIEGNGTIAVDVTDPQHPHILAHIPGDYLDPGKDSEAQFVRVCDIANGTYLLRDAASRTRHELWNVTDPAHPEFVNIIVDGLKGTHKNWWECDTGIAYLVSQDPTWRRRPIKIYDLSDPVHPRFIRDFGLDGQQPGSGMEPAPGPIHGPISYQGRVYFAYGSSSMGTIQIVDREKLLNGNPEPTPVNLLSPQIGRLDMPRIWGAHTTYPMLGVHVKEFEKDAVGSVKDILVVTSETPREDCRNARAPLFLLDISEPQYPFPIANFLVPEQSGNFCARGGRFGPHSIQESFTPLFYGKMVMVSYFNAGVRAVDVRDPFHPVEAGFYIPAITERTKPICYEEQGKQICSTVIQTNNVEVDERGYIYIVDRSGTGMHILELTGDARAVLESE